MKKAISLLLLFIAVIFALIALEGNVPGTTHAGASPLNTGWDGTSNMVELLSKVGDKVVIVKDWGRLNEFIANASNEYCKTIVLVSPEKPFNTAELSAIRELVLNRNFCLIILDEGPHGNQVLDALEAPLEIEDYGYIVDEEGSYIVWSAIEVYGRSLRVALAYASPIRVHDNETCKYIGYANGIPVGALCKLDNSSILVIGDGSIVTNSALTPLNEYNPYTVVFRGVINEVCKNINTTRGKVFLVEGSKYNVRVLTPFEILASNMPFSEKLKLLFNPARYLYQLIVAVEEEANSLMCLNVAVLITTVVLVVRLSRKSHSEVKEEKSVTEHPWYRLPIPLIKSLCTETGICPEEFSCISKKRIAKECKEMVYKRIVVDKELRKRIIKAQLMQLYGVKVLSENEVIL